MFERKPMEKILANMITWAKGATTKITDFRVGSKVRTIFEAVAVVVEELYDKVYRAMKQLIEENIYAVIGFNKEPATHANGTVRMSRSTTAPENYYIPAGTEVLSKATQYTAPIKYKTTEDAVLEVGKTFVDVPIVCTEAGVHGNVGAGDIVDFVQKPTGVESVTNQSATTGGSEEETKEEQKSRFQTFIEANSRGTTQAVKYGAELAELKDANGAVTESVKQAVALEDLVNKLGQIDVYIWNGTGTASANLISEVSKILKGYYDENGNAVYGYKPAGIITNVYTATTKSVTLKVTLTVESWASDAEVKTEIENVIDAHFNTLRIGSTLFQTSLEAEIKYIEGVKDVKLELSIDGGLTYTTTNVTATSSEIIIPSKPINYV